MSILKRYYAANQIYFVTSVTYDRQPHLSANYDLLWQAFNTAKEKTRFDLIAYVLLPDHFHILIEPGENNLSDILHRIKLSFGAKYRKRHNLLRGSTWQRRFWDHVIRNQDDMNRHIDYIHYNPVKHGLVDSPFLYEHTSIHQYKKEGYYGLDWGCKEKLEFDGEFGES